MAFAFTNVVLVCETIIAFSLSFYHRILLIANGRLCGTASVWRRHAARGLSSEQALRYTLIGCCLLTCQELQTHMRLCGIIRDELAFSLFMSSRTPLSGH